MGKILILGGTQFIGRNIAQFLRRNTSHDIVLFNRGVTSPEVNAEFECILGDRYSADINKISNQKWDFVIDVSCYYPEGVERIKRAMNHKPELYIFISTCSVYDHVLHTNSFRDESYPILSCSGEEATDVGTGSYGARKAECERIVEGYDFPTAILRPALVVGPNDHTDRFYYWVEQVYKGRQLLVPGNGSRIFSVTYVMDLVRMIIELINQPKEGIYNAVSYPSLSIREIIRSLERIFNKKSEVNFVPEEWLLDHSVKPWMDVPLWLNTDMYTYDSSKFRSTFNFSPTPWAEALVQTVHYHKRLNWPSGIYGMKEEQKRDLIRKYRESQEN